jgi:uncharacterized protein YaiL (DUF2058 family)
MSNTLREQLLKAGLVNKQQLNKAKQDKQKQQKKQRNVKHSAGDEALAKSRQLAAQKAERDRELNRQKQEQARKKAISIEIDQLISNNLIKRDAKCEIAYNFEHRNKVSRLYVNAEMRQQLIQGKLGIARIEGRYELITRSIAEKIQQRNEKRVILFEAQDEQSKKPAAADDPYADFQIPDDLMW